MPKKNDKFLAKCWKNEQKKRVTLNYSFFCLVVKAFSRLVD